VEYIFLRKYAKEVVAEEQAGFRSGKYNNPSLN